MLLPVSDRIIEAARKLRSMESFTGYTNPTKMNAAESPILLHDSTLSNYMDEEISIAVLKSSLKALVAESNRTRLYADLSEDWCYGAAYNVQKARVKLDRINVLINMVRFFLDKTDDLS